MQPIMRSSSSRDLVGCPRCRRSEAASAHSAGWRVGQLGQQYRTGCDDTVGRLLARLRRLGWLSEWECRSPWDKDASAPRKLRVRCGRLWIRPRFLSIATAPGWDAAAWRRMGLCCRGPPRGEGSDPTALWGPVTNVGRVLAQFQNGDGGAVQG